MQRVTGQYVRCSVPGEPFSAFVPSPLPPVPPLALTDEDDALLGRANRAIGELNGLTTALPDAFLLMYMYIRKEAVLSSQIEGTQSSLSDLLLFESAKAPGVPLNEVQEVSMYVKAMDHGLKQLRDGFPLSLRLIREIHGILLSKGRGSDKTPGEFRRTQNWVGGTRPGNARFVPPPPDRLMECLDSFEKYIHNEASSQRPLVNAALTHVQFETIHPFLDGNGRVGRLLIAFLLCVEGALKEPILYLSLYFKRNRQQYYDLIQLVRDEGDWEAWLRFFLAGVLETAEQVGITTRRILEMFENDRQRLSTLGRYANSALRVHELLQRNPIISIPNAAKVTRLTPPTAAKSFNRLAQLGIVREVTGRRRNRIFAYSQYLDILDEGTEPL